MSLLLLESFDDGLYAQRATSSWGVDEIGGRTGSTARRLYDQNRGMYWSFTPRATVIVGFAINNRNNQDQRDILRLYGDNKTVFHVGIDIMPTGAIQITRGGGAVIAETDVEAVKLNEWHYVELFCTVDDVNGVLKLRVDGKMPAGWADQIGVDTRNGGTSATVDTVQLIGYREWWLDDVYIADDQGTVNNDLLGDTRVYTLLPNGDGGYSQLLGSDGDSLANYALVDENPPNTADYVGSATDGAKDTYQFSDLGLTSGIVRGVMASAYAAKTDTQPKSGRLLVKRGATDVFGTDQTLATSPSVLDEVWDQDPISGGAWTIANVNVTEFGFEVRP